MVCVTLARTQWETILEATDPPTYGEIVATLNDRDLADEDPTALLEGAIDDNLLVEWGEGAFPKYELGSDEAGAKEPGSGDATLSPNPTKPARRHTKRSLRLSISGPPSTLIRPTMLSVHRPRLSKRRGWRASSRTRRGADSDAPVECTHSDHDEPTTCAECRHHAG